MNKHTSEAQHKRSMLRMLRHLLPDNSADQEEPASAPTQPAGAGAPPEATLSSRLDTLEQQMHAIQESLQATYHQHDTARDQVQQTVQEHLSALEKQINRAGREQLKTNSLAETQLEQLSEALNLLRTADERRAAELDSLQQQVAASQDAARLDVVQAMLPALDSLDEAMRSGRALLEQPAAPPPAPPAKGFARLAAWLRGPTPQPRHESKALREAMAAWLEGLHYVRQRLLDVLASQNVRPIEAHHQPFDPQLHVVLDVVPAHDDLPPGVVANEFRRGYMQGSRVLRHTEVAVAKANQETAEAE